MLLLNADPSLTPIQLARAMVLYTVRGLGDPPSPDTGGGVDYDLYPNPSCGRGRLDVAAAVDSVLP